MKINARLFSIFRFVFGILMIPQVLSLVPSIHDLANSTFVFHYPGLEFIEAYSHELIDFLKYIAISGAILLAIGIVPRFGALLFFLSFGYLFLIDQSFYNNHYYLWVLISFLLFLTPNHQGISIVDVLNNRFEKSINPTVLIFLGLLISIVYFFGGIAKLNADWLNGYPMILLAKSRNYPFPELTGYALSYIGLTFDLVIPFLIWTRPNKWYVYVPYFTFNLFNYFIFNIGEFPLVMMICYILFLELNKINGQDKKQLIIQFWNSDKLKSVLIGLFFFFNVFFPLRSHLVSGNVAWHRQGYCFSWRMMLNNSKFVEFQYLVVIPDKNIQYAIDFRNLVTYRQFYHLYNDPFMIWSLAQKLKDDAMIKYNSPNVKVFAKSIVQLNQHNQKELINSDVDLCSEKYRCLQKNTFINYMP